MARLKIRHTLNWLPSFFWDPVRCAANFDPEAGILFFIRAYIVGTIVIRGSTVVA